MSQDTVEISAEKTNDVLDALDQLIGDLPECVNAPECSDGSGMG